ncbi:pseudouridine synthase [Paracoccus sp. KR1-242]|uniref:pseudouridine synthase n=1 Tax=Paracoccus sp. KR1-242 TaxID=3410028 RepID=UPI003C068AAF
MTDIPDTPESESQKSEGDRIAKVMARSGVASRREAERMIIEGRVSVNGKKIDSPALDVLPSDRITVDGKKLEEPQETRLWMYYKPLGLVTTESDEKGRQTVFDALPRDLPRVMTVGRLDLNSEGLLLLTNDGELKRRLELPTTGWLRRYRVRVNGTPNDLTFAPLRRGVTIDGEDFAPMEIKLDSQQGANAWLTVGIREGKNREIRRAMNHVGLIVNRLIRVGYGPFKLTGMEENEVREIKRKVLRDQLGGLLTGEETDAKPRSFRDRGAAGEEREGRSGAPFARREDGDRKPYARREGDDRKPFARREDGDRKPYAKREDGDRKPYARRDGDDRKPFARREDGDRKPYAKREDGDRKPYARREGDDRKSFARREDGDRKPYAKREDGDRKPYARRDGEDRKPFARREDGDRKPYAKREDGDRKPYARREGDDRKPFARREDGDRKPYAKREDGDRKPYARREGDDRKPFARREDGERKSFGKPGERGGKSFGGKPGGKPFGKPGAKPGPRGGSDRGPARGPRKG